MFHSCAPLSGRCQGYTLKHAIAPHIHAVCETQNRRDSLDLDRLPERWLQSVFGMVDQNQGCRYSYSTLLNSDDDDYRI
jgi:hypothetical protein